jgi:hypothetical protein
MNKRGVVYAIVSTWNDSPSIAAASVSVHPVVYPRGKPCKRSRSAVVMQRRLPYWVHSRLARAMSACTPCAKYGPATYRICVKMLVLDERCANNCAILQTGCTRTTLWASEARPCLSIIRLMRFITSVQVLVWTTRNLLCSRSRSHKGHFRNLSSSRPRNWPMVSGGRWPRLQMNPAQSDQIANVRALLRRRWQTHERLSNSAGKPQLLQ